MKLLFPIAFIIFCLIQSCNHGNSATTIKQTKDTALSQIVNYLANDSGAEYSVKSSWEAFRQAIILNDLKKVKSLSTFQIKSSFCTQNQPSKGSNENILSIDKFIQDCFNQIFDSDTRARLTKIGGVRFLDDDSNKQVFLQSAYPNSNYGSDFKLVEVLLTKVEPTTSDEGFEYSFEFIGKGNNFKFCGFDTVP